MNSSGNSSSTESIMCVKGCGFYGASQNRNMCSKCYKDDLQRELILKTRSAETQKSVSIKKPIEEETQRKNRCENCKKKVGLTGFNCRCGKLLCGIHRYPQEHGCAFDFKDSDRRILAKQNVLVKADKLATRI